MRVLVLLMLSFVSTACALPRWPVQGPLTSPYGLRFLGLRPDFHHGVDVSVPTGTPVVSMANGTIEFAGEMRGYGTVVIMSHPGAVKTVYAHLSALAVKKGDSVKAGQRIGLSGQSGNAGGPHLHFEVLQFGREVDPVAMLGMPPARR